MRLRSAGRADCHAPWTTGLMPQVAWSSRLAALAGSPAMRSHAAVRASMPTGRPSGRGAAGRTEPRARVSRAVAGPAAVGRGWSELPAAGRVPGWRASGRHAARQYPRRSRCKSSGAGRSTRTGAGAASRTARARPPITRVTGRGSCGPALRGAGRGPAGSWRRARWRRCAGRSRGTRSSRRSWTRSSR